MKTVLMIVGVILLLVILAVLAAAVWFFRFAHLRVGNTDDMLDDEIRRACRSLVEAGLAYVESRPHEEVSVTSFDGLKLRGIYLPIENPRGCILCFHGYRSFGMQDFAPMPEYYQSLGLSVLVVDQRACGKSEGKYTTFGILERRDVVTWANYMKERVGDLPLMLDGLSLGSATVMLSADQPLPETVCGIIADCGFTSPWDILTHCGKKWFHIPAFPMVHILSCVARVMFGGGYRSVDTREALAKSSLPLLLLHGADDDFVPTWMSGVHYDAATGYKRKVIVPGAGHGMSYITDMPRCQKELSDFVDHVLA